VRVAVTCLQLIRDLDRYRPALAAAGIDVSVPAIPGQHLEGDALVAALDGCVGVIAGDDRFTAAVLAACPELTTISKWGIGIDGIDLAAAAAQGVTVTNTPGVFDDEVADVAMAYVTTLARSLHVVDRGVHRGEWPKPAGRSLRGRTLGVVGLGGIGRALAARAAAAGMTVAGTDPAAPACTQARAQGVRIESLAELLPASEFLSVNCPLNESTFHLIDAAAIARMPAGAYLINTGRGAVVSTDAVVAALERGHLAGVALDVMEDEPPPPDSPLRGRDDVVFGSHNASNTLDASLRVHVMAIENLAASLGLMIDVACS
jgi:D-3-phosphoglycerate dehydrogenase